MSQLKREVDLKTPLTEPQTDHHLKDNIECFDEKVDFAASNDDFLDADTEQERIQKMCFCR